MRPRPDKAFVRQGLAEFRPGVPERVEHYVVVGFDFNILPTGLMPEVMAALGHGRVGPDQRRNCSSQQHAAAYGLDVKEPLQSFQRTLGGCLDRRYLPAGG